MMELKAINEDRN